MSLINDALRKAQKQRTGESPPLASMPAIGGESAMRISKRARPAGFYTLLIQLGAVAALLGVLIIGGVVLLRNKSPGTAGQQSATIDQTGVSRPADSVPVAGQQPAAPVSAATAFVVPIANPPAVQKAENSGQRTAAAVSRPPLPARAEESAPRAEAPKPVDTTTASPVPAKPQPVKPAKLEPKALIFIESLKVVGIRASTTDSKVLMNDRVYRIGDTIEHEMGIKLTGITSNSLTFEDERGGSYTRTF